MRFIIKETRELEELSIIDPRTGINWVSDLMGNHGVFLDLPEEEGVYIIPEEDFDWWRNLLAKYEEADNRYYDLYTSLPEDEAASLQDAVTNISGDLEDYPGHMNECCDEFENH